MSPWTWRHVWPVEDNTTSYREAVSFAGQELGYALAEQYLLPAGEVVWEMAESETRRWPYTELVLVAKVPVVPAHPSREQWPVLLGFYRGRGWTDARIAALLGLKEAAVKYQRHKLGLVHREAA